jgi:hypothetical protein
MKALTTAIWGKLAGSSLQSSVANRLFKNRAPDGVEYPYIVYKVITGLAEYTFSEDFENPTIQFDIYSKDGSTGEIEDIFTALTALYDNCSLSPTNERVLNMQRSTYSLIDEDHTTPTGEQHVFHYAINYEIILERS